MAEVDSLEIKIESDAKIANQAIKSIIDNLDNLSKALNIDTSKLANIGKAINANEITSAAKNMQSQTQKVSKSLSQITEQYKDLGEGFEIKGSTQQIQKEIDRLTNQLEKAKLAKEDFETSGKTNLGGYETSVKNVIKYTNQIESLKNQLAEIQSDKPTIDFKINGMETAKSQISDISEKLRTVSIPQSAFNYNADAMKAVFGEAAAGIKNWTQATQQFGANAGAILNQTVVETDALKSKTEQFEQSLKNLKIPPINTENISTLQRELAKAETEIEKLRTKLANGITMGRISANVDDKGFRNLQEQITYTEKYAEALKNRISDVNKAAQNTTGLKNVENGAKEAAKSFQSLSKNSLKASNSLKKVQTSLKGVLSALLPILGIREIMRFGKESIKSSMDYIETLNYFDAAFGQVAQNADLSAFEKMGYDSADTYYNSFAQRAEELTAKMSGFTIGEGGLLESTGAVSLGLDPSQLMNYQAMFSQMSSSMGVSSENALKLSQALTEIGADLASIKNMEFEDVWNDMASGLAGMSRTLDKYGVNIRNVNLQQKLNALGIEANISALNQNDKALLRAIILLENTKYAWGDLADTINQPANQLRLIQANFQNLSRTIGNLFLPVVKTVLPYINALVIAVQRLFAWLGNLIGIDISDISTSIGGADIGGILDQTDDLADSLGGVAANAKKAKAGLRAFDELKTISMPEESKGGGGVGEIGGGLLDAAFEDAFSKYQQEWDRAFAGLENRAQEVADKIEKAFEPIKKIIQDFAIGDFFQAGKDTSALVAGIFNFFADAIDKVDWYGIGKKIGDFFAGIDWLSVLKSVGNLIWQALKAAFEMYVGAFSTAPLETSLVSLAAFPKLLKAITASKFITGAKKLGNGIKVLSESFSLLKMGITDKQFSAGVKAAFENIRENLTKTQKVAIGVIGVFAEFSLVKSGFYDLASGADNLVISFGKIAAGAGIAVGALKLIGLSNPWTALIVGATGLVGAIMGIDKAQEDALKKLAESQELEVFGGKLAETSEKILSISQQTEDWLLENKKYLEGSGIAEMQYAQDLADRYFELYENKNRTNEQTEEAQRLAQELVNQFDDLQQYYNDETGLIDTTRESVEKLIEQRLKEIKISAAEDKLKEAYQKRLEQLEALESATENMELALQKANEMQERYNSLSAQKEAYLQWEELGRQIMNGVDATGELEKKQKELYDFIMQGRTEFPTLIALNEELISVGTEIEAFSGNYNQALEDFSVADTTYQNIEEEITKLSDFISNESREAAGESVTSYSEEILNRVDSVKESAQAVAKETLNPLKDAEKEAPKIGANITKGIARGIKSGFPELSSAAEKLANLPITVTKEGLQEHSPSKVMFKIGDFATEGLGIGLKNKYNSILSSAKNFTNDLQIAHAPDFEKKYKQYQNIVSGYDYAYINENKYNYEQDARETNVLLRKILEAIHEGKTITIGQDEVGKASVRYIQGEESRLQKSIVGTY